MRRTALSLSLLLAACATPDDAPVIVKPAPPPEAVDGAIAARPMPSAPLSLARAPRRFAFASCAQQNEDQSIYRTIAADEPDLVLLMGDNVYGDVRSRDPALPELKAAYMRLAASAPFAELRAASPVLTTWDDHDYGLNDAGGDWPYKQTSDALFDFVWDVPADDPRRGRPGVYGSWTFGEAGERLQLIVLDTRYFRSPLKPTDERDAKGKERYLPDDDPAKTMLGEAQWAWLLEELKKPADLRVIVSSIQVIAEGHGFEAWRTLPLEREKLYRTIDAAGAANVVVLSGDRHAAGLYRREGVLDYPLHEATSSSLNLPQSRWRAERGDTYVEPGPYRTSEFIFVANYGIADIDWARKTLALSIRGEDGQPIASETIDFAALK
ncbi:MAG: alkaline phosphatase D family protein [Parvularculaceae bacterium]